MLNIDIVPTSQGKVRDLYDLGDRLLFVASDRISAFDYVLPDEIPFKGEILTQVSLFWFEKLSDLIGTHFISADVADLPEEFQPYAAELDGRFMIVKKAKMFPVECIVRGYLAGSGYKEYMKTQTLAGVELPAGLVESSPLPEPMFTPSTKAEIGEHDENITFDQLVDLIGDEAANTLSSKSIELYNRAVEIAREGGLIIADTKFEFGMVDGEIVLADEVLTPDSSRFWHGIHFKPGGAQPSFDKQYIRDWLSANWDGTGEPPHLPADVIENTTEKYKKAFEMLTGRKFISKKGN